MLAKLLLPAVALGLAASQADAQVTVTTPRAMRMERGDSPRAVIGVGTSSSASPRDTLGLLVTSITPKSPAEQAGVEEGNRIAAVNGTSLRLAAGDVDDPDMRGIMQRRLTRELAKVKPGDEVELRVYANGQYRTVRVKAADSQDLYAERGLVFRTRDDDRPTLGLGIGSTGSRRDTLGVFVMYVSDSGPAARAGIVEGDRIAAINNVDVRVSRDDAGDAEIAGAKARRLERQVADLRPGDDAELRVWSDGRYRTVKVKIGRASDLPRRRNSVFIMGNGIGMIPPVPPLPAMDIDVDIDPALFGAPMQRALERAMESSQRAMEGAQRAMERIDRAWVAPRVFEWNDDDVDHDAPEPPAPAPPAAAPRPSAGRS